MAWSGRDTRWNSTTSLSVTNHTDGSAPRCVSVGWGGRGEEEEEGGLGGGGGGGQGCISISKSDWLRRMKSRTDNLKRMYFLLVCLWSTLVYKDQNCVHVIFEKKRLERFLKTHLNSVDNYVYKLGQITTE